MQIDQALAFASPIGRGVLTTARRDGRPQLSNISFGVGDDGVVRISVTAGRAKTANARRDPRVSLHVTSADFWSYVVLDADASLTPVAKSPDDDTVAALVALYRSIAGEHPDWAEFRSAMVTDRRLVMSLRPTHAYGMLPADDS